MKLEPTTFDQLELADECLFRNEFGEVVQAVKYGKEHIVNRVTGKKAYTGQYHSVYRIVDPTFKPRKRRGFMERLTIYIYRIRYRLGRRSAGKRTASF